MNTILSADLQAFRKERTKLACEKEQVDLIVTSLPENTEYLGGYYPEGVAMLYISETFLVYDPKTQRSGIISSASDVPTMLDAKYTGTIYPVGSFNFTIASDDAFACKVKDVLSVRYDSVYAGLAKAIADICPDAKKIAIDDARMTRQAWDTVVATCPEATCIPARSLMLEIQKVKHPVEVELIRQSTNITEDAFEAVCKQITIGTSEYDIWKTFGAEVAKRGADPYFCTCAMDQRSAFSDTFNRPDVCVKEGSVIRFDFGCILYRRYRSDIARTVIVGKNQKASDYYQGILDGEKAAIDAIRPGVKASDIFHIAEDTVQKTIPHYRRHHCGHGIGIATYGPPSIAPADDSPLEAGMVLCIETPYYEIGWGGVQVEDTIVVTETGCEYLTKSTQDVTYIEV